MGPVTSAMDHFSFVSVLRVNTVWYIRCRHWYIILTEQIRTHEKYREPGCLSTRCLRDVYMHFEHECAHTLRVFCELRVLFENYGEWRHMPSAMTLLQCIKLVNTSRHMITNQKHTNFTHDWQIDCWQVRDWTCHQFSLVIQFRQWPQQPVCTPQPAAVTPFYVPSRTATYRNDTHTDRWTRLGTCTFYVPSRTATDRKVTKPDRKDTQAGRGTHRQSGRTHRQAGGLVLARVHSVP
jgi:hypothetical protein